MEEIFISYKRKDLQRVKELVEFIERELNIKCWMDLKGIDYGLQFGSIICYAIDNANVVLFMHSREHLEIDYQTDWTIKELTYARLTGKKIILVKLDDSPLKNVFLLEYGTLNNVDSNDPIQLNKLIAELKKLINDRSDIGKPQIAKEVSATLSSMLTNQKTNVLVDAENDDSDSQFFIGWQYSQGIDGVMNYFKAVEWWKKAANNGNAKATFELGNCYETGLGGLPKSLETAIVYWKKAINLGYIDEKNKLGKAYYTMGLKYKQGVGVQQDSYEAVNFWEKAVEQGNSDAMYKLAQCYKYGKGVEQDVFKAKSLLQKASELGNNDAMKALKMM